MFRRKGEDTLFDTADSSEGHHMAMETVTVNPPSAPAVNSHAPAAANNIASAAPVQPARPAMDLRSGSAPTAGAFRPNASTITGDLARNRMPEVKSNAALPASLIPATGIEKANKSGRRVLTVGNDILLKGEIATCDRLVIEGKVDATLNDVHTVEISENGSFKGSANIEDAEISGLFEGDLVVRNRLVIYGTGKVRGKISYGEIEIARGGELTGEIKTVSAQPGARPVARPATATTTTNATVPAPKEEKAAA